MFGVFAIGLPKHPSASALDQIAAELALLADVPSLLLWGSKDKVFSDLYLHDLERRLAIKLVRFPVLVGVLANYSGFLAPKVALFSNIALMMAVLLWRPRGLYPVTSR